jgi:hypothetical protein
MLLEIPSRPAWIPILWGFMVATTKAGWYGVIECMDKPVKASLQ